MGTTYSARVVFGIKVSNDELNKKTPNPMWGVHRYDPQSGRPVKEFIVENYIDADELAGEYKVDYYSTGDCGHHVFGKLIGEEVGSYKGDIEEIPNLSQADRDKMIEKLFALANKIGIASFPKTYIVFNYG